MGKGKVEAGRLLQLCRRDGGAGGGAVEEAADGEERQPLPRKIHRLSICQMRRVKEVSCVNRRFGTCVWEEWEWEWGGGWSKMLCQLQSMCGMDRELE